MSATTTTRPTVGATKNAARQGGGGVLNRRRGTIATVAMAVLALAGCSSCGPCTTLFRTTRTPRPMGFLFRWMDPDCTEAWSRGNFGLHLKNSCCDDSRGRPDLFLSSLVAFVLARFSYRFNLTLLGSSWPPTSCHPSAAYPGVQDVQGSAAATFMSERLDVNSWALILVSTAFQMGFTFVLSIHEPLRTSLRVCADGRRERLAAFGNSRCHSCDQPWLLWDPSGDVDLQRVLLGDGAHLPRQQAARRSAQQSAGKFFADTNLVGRIVIVAAGARRVLRPATVRSVSLWARPRDKQGPLVRSARR